MYRYKSVSAFAPASVANVSCGFDIMGFALASLGDIVTINTCSSTDSSVIKLSGKYASLVSSDRKKNTAGIAIDALLLALGKMDSKLIISLEKNLPIGSGLGSSAASAVAGVMAANYFLGTPLDKSDLIEFALAGEKFACGTAHADNVAPSLMGGFNLIRSYSPLDIISLESPEDLFCAVIYPHIELKTSDSRRVLKKELSLQQAVKQSANTAGFMMGLLKSDYALIERSMTDLIAEPQRKQLIPDFDNLKSLALKNGALGFGISGSGPAVFALCRTEQKANKLADIVKARFLDLNLASETYISPLNARGAHIQHSLMSAFKI
jgi:homoserine kinase